MLYAVVDKYIEKRNFKNPGNLFIRDRLFLNPNRISYILDFVSKYPSLFTEIVTFRYR